MYCFIFHFVLRKLWRFSEFHDQKRSKIKFHRHQDVCQPSPHYTSFELVVAYEPSTSHACCPISTKLKKPIYPWSFAYSSEVFLLSFLDLNLGWTERKSFSYFPVFLILLILSYLSRKKIHINYYKRFAGRQNNFSHRDNFKAI